MYQVKGRDYYSNVREELIGMVDKGKNKILELGCGTGNTGYALKEVGAAKEVIGIELVPKVAQEAKMKLDKVICGDVEVIDLPFEEEYFDYILCGDVLEHLRDPWLVLKKIKPYLKRGGYIIASIPNIRHWRILRDLIFKGKWQYTREGILDDTHLRFFTRREIIKLFQTADFEIKKISYKLGKKSKIVNAATFGIFNDFLAIQFLVTAKKVGRK